MKEYVIIKSSKYGLTVYLDEELPYQELLMEIEKKFKASARFFAGTEVAISFENRILTKVQEQEIVKRISAVADVRILCIMEQDEKTDRIYKSVVEETLALIPEHKGTFYRGTLKRQQILETEKSVVIIGDVLEGATVVSKGDIIVIGTIYGSAQAGACGKSGAFIAALGMEEPVYLRIGSQEVKPVIGGKYSWAKLL